MNKTFRIILIVLLILITAGIVTNFILSDYLEKKISDNYMGGFHLTAKKVSVNLFSRSVNIKGVLITDSIPGEREIDIPELQVKGISYYNLLFNNKYKATKIKILDPEIIYISQQDSTSETKSQSSEFKLLVKKIEIRNARILLFNADSAMHDTILSNTMGMDIWDLSVGEPSAAYRYKRYGMSRIALNIEKGIYYLPNQLYRLQADKVNYDSNDSLFTVMQFQLLTNFTRYGIGEYAKTQQDWLHLTFDDISLNQIDAGRFIKDTLLTFNTLQIGFLNALAFKDRRLPFPEKPDTKLPMAMIDAFPFKLHFDSLNIADGYVEYSERAPNSSDEGQVNFKELTAHAENLSNARELIFGKTTMHASARVMGETRLDADFVFPNVKHPEPYTTQGYLNPVAINKFSTILTQATGAEVKSGTLKNLWFNFSYDNDVSNGSMIFEYENLNVFMVDREDMKKKGITSFFVNTFVLKKENIRGRDSFKEGKINFERNKKKAIFNYWWKSLMSGFIDTVAPG